MEFSKPELSEKQKKDCNQIYSILAGRRKIAKKENISKFLTREELLELLGWEKTKSDDRKLRDAISALRKIKPIISNSKNKGYALAMYAEDLEDVNHTWREFDSRQEDIEDSKKPLISFSNTYEKGYAL